MLSNKPNSTTSKIKKTSRKTSQYDHNMTASLKLQKIADEPLAPTTSFFSSLYTSTMSMLSKPTPVVVNAQKDQKAQDIDLTLPQLEELEDKCQKILADDKKTEDEKNAAIDELSLQKVELVKNEIIEHAARRVDLFFYLLTAVHGKYALISRASTNKQHGQGSGKAGTHACHSSFFPNIKLVKAPSNLSLYLTEKLPTFISQKLLPLIDEKDAPVLAGTHFEESLNMTAELPSVVNVFDGIMERIFMPDKPTQYQPTKYYLECLEILNKASRNQIDLRQGMNDFFKVMNSFFNDFDTKIIKYDSIKLPKTMKKISEYEKIGTFKAANDDTHTIKEKYISLMFLPGKNQQKTQETIFNSKPLVKVRLPRKPKPK